MSIELTHIYSHYEYTLCGWAFDEIEENLLDTSNDTFPDPDWTKGQREEVKKMKIKKIEFGSNCKDCIKILKDLRKIKK